MLELQGKSGIPTWADCEFRMAVATGCSGTASNPSTLETEGSPQQGLGGRVTCVAAEVHPKGLCTEGQGWLSLSILKFMLILGQGAL